MSREYTPDRWTVLELNHPEGEVHCRILGSWYGGFAGSDSWKMSSGITRIEEYEHGWLVHNVSGSVYRCRRGAKGTSSLAAGVLASYQKEMREIGGDIRELDGLSEVRL